MIPTRQSRSASSPASLPTLHLSTQDDLSIGYGRPAHQQHPEYTPAAATLINSLAETTGADTLLEFSRQNKMARQMLVEEDLFGLVATESIRSRAIVLKVNGHVSMPNEVRRQPGGSDGVIMYDGLMKGPSGEDLGSAEHLICIDTKVNGNDTRHVRRSCLPNAVFKHVIASQATLGIVILAVYDIERNVEVTLPFDADWKESDSPLECALHLGNMDLCGFEAERRRCAEARAADQVGMNAAPIQNNIVTETPRRRRNQVGGSNRNSSGRVPRASRSVVPSSSTPYQSQQQEERRRRMEKRNEAREAARNRH